ncbi:hypothetical protein B0T17DRAFT_324205 [Bombardia bombarda]|uniref:Mitochondrial intermediate peptidase n=1 Tax=Bombardia bombarda TaxID=252184 RepID=A0AA39WMG1_9PEZI|nr:hypothetical protein B0T17DRAFT_324205 [Bombardia bombarda]
MISPLRLRLRVPPSSLLRRVSPPGQRRWLLSTSTPQATVSSDPATEAPIRRVKSTGYLQRLADKRINVDEDKLLREIFDSAPVWQEFSQVPHTAIDRGLFRNRHLVRHDGFLVYARISLRRARAVVEKVLSAATVDEYRAIVRHLDRLSDILCRVLDMTDFVRVTHPNPMYQRKASEAWEMVYEYMNTLNTMTGLNVQLGKAMENPEVTASWSEEEMVVAQILRLDFTKSAVNLPKKARDKFVMLSSEISRTQSAFINEMSPELASVALPSSKLWGMAPLETRGLTRGGMTYLPTLSPYATSALRRADDAEARRLIFNASRTASTRTVGQLEHLMRLRGELAKLSGFQSFAHLTLQDRMMARTPEAVDSFLRTLALYNAPAVVDERELLVQWKKKQVPGAESIDPWDKDYYSSLIRERMKSAYKDEDLRLYFSVGTVMQGLSRLFKKLYGLRLVPKELRAGETWHPDVRRLDVISDIDGHVAVLYCDLFHRPDKSPNPAHFTIRCSREITKDEMAEFEQDPEEHYSIINVPLPETKANDGMDVSNKSGVVKQLPTIALICDFQRAPGEPGFLSFFQVETLLHEMGHAVHSILARTSFQNVAGTRCATDLAELPSTLMEYFAADPSVLKLIGRHYKTGDPLPESAIPDIMRITKRFEASETENQIIMAMLDQTLHSPQALESSFDSTEIYHTLQRLHGKMPPDPKETRWQGFFGHLSGYGATYYSYLFDRALAQRVWKVVFNSGVKGGALNRENGEWLKENLLKWGGSRDPWRCLADTLEDDRLANGGESAMALVGSWHGSSDKKILSKHFALEEPHGEKNRSDR